MFRPRPNLQIVYEVLSADQDRAAAFVRDVVKGDGKSDGALIDCAAHNAQKLFGRAYIIQTRTGMVRPLRMFDDAPGVANQP